MDKKIEQLCQSDIINSKNILHIIDSIEYEILDHHFKYAFYSSLIRTPKNYLFINEETSRVCKIMRKRYEDSFRALLLIQGKNKDNNKELDRLIRLLVKERYNSLINQKILTTGSKQGTTMMKLDRPILNIIDRLSHIPEHEKTVENVDKAMKFMMDHFQDMGKNILGDNFKGFSMDKLFENTGRKIDLSKILGTETKENVDIIKNDKKEE